MNQSLADLISAHKFLCEAVAGQGVGSGSPARPQSAQTAATKPQDAASVAYLTEQEEDQLEKQMGFAPEPFMDKMVAEQFSTIFEEREELRQKPEAPQPITHENRQELKAASKIPSYSNVRPGPSPIPRIVEPVPPEIAKRDKMQQDRWEQPEAIRPFVPFDNAKIVGGLFPDLDGFQQQQG